MSDLTKQSELKNCPFCGGNASTMRHAFFDKWQTSCTECHCGTPQRFESPELAAAAWNTRPASAGVRVRRLEWIDTGQRGFLQAHYYAIAGTLRHTCHPVVDESGPFFEHYSIEHVPQYPEPWKLVYWVGNNGLSGVNKRFGTLEAAKEAAQADFERRILFALSDHRVQKSGAGANTKSGGGVEGHALKRQEPENADVRERAGIKPGPSDSLLSKTLSEGEQKRPQIESSRADEGSSLSRPLREARPSVPSDGFNCIWLYEDGREVGHLNGPQDDPAVIARSKHWATTACGGDA